MKNKIQIVSFEVAQANKSILIDTETDLKHDLVKSVFAVISDQDGQKQSTLKLSVDGEEILPKGFDISLITPTESLSFSDVALPFSELAKGSKIKGEYEDKGHANAYPYTVKIYFGTTSE